ncbi:hypothetical protein CDAR_438861 [Caerostris darwini]|uniref:Uncharacterized protein n=1 Tax=Caerostris darwini TaxID=1538125 RepID=A0AAV4X2C6_9ARAC|nr:hypothetical protein CDAR_438861 [Caerostris darwini]
MAIFYPGRRRSPRKSRTPGDINRTPHKPLKVLFFRCHPESTSFLQPRDGEKGGRSNRSGTGMEQQQTIVAKNLDRIAERMATPKVSDDFYWVGKGGSCVLLSSPPSDKGVRGIVKVLWGEDGSVHLEGYRGVRID